LQHARHAWGIPSRYWRWSPAWPHSNPTRAPLAPTRSWTPPCRPPPACSSSWLAFRHDCTTVTTPAEQAAATVGLTSVAAELGKAAEALHGLIELAEMTRRFGRTGKTDLN
jgi:hypothetical protein